MFLIARPVAMGAVITFSEANHLVQGTKQEKPSAATQRRKNSRVR